MLLIPRPNYETRYFIT